MKNKVIVIAIIICIILAITLLINLDYTPTESSDPGYSMDDLIIDSYLIVKGRVIDVGKDKWNNKCNIEPMFIKDWDTMYKDVVINIDRVFKGNIKSNQITVKSYLEQADDDKLDDFYRADFHKSDEVILFLVKDSTTYNKLKTRGEYVVLGGFQGMYVINSDSCNNTKEQVKLSKFYKKIKLYNKNPIPSRLNHADWVKGDWVKNKRNTYYKDGYDKQCK